MAPREEDPPASSGLSPLDTATPICCSQPRRPLRDTWTGGGIERHGRRLVRIVKAVRAQHFSDMRVDLDEYLISI